MYCPIESCKSQLKYEPEKWNDFKASGIPTFGQLPLVVSYCL